VPHDGVATFGEIPMRSRGPDAKLAASPIAGRSP